MGVGAVRVHLYRARWWLVGALRRILPERARAALRRLDEKLEPIGIALYRRRKGEARPIPPRLLRERVGATTIESFFETGESFARSVELGLVAADTSLRDCRRILDFGCGAGKVLQFLVTATDAELHGCDIHAGSIHWAQRNIGDARFEQSGFYPPLSYSDASFDCIFAWSVFSHLDEPTQDAWLGELRRVLAPDGVLLASILSDGSPALNDNPVMDVVGDDGVRSGHDFVPYRNRGASYLEYSGTDQPCGITYISREYVMSEWSRAMDVKAILPLALGETQDIVVMSTPPDPK